MSELQNNRKYSNIWFVPKYFNVLEKYRGKNNIKFLEIGSFEGYGTNYFVENFLQGENSEITCIDPWIKYSQSTITNINEWDNVINEETYNIFINNTKGNSNKIIVKRGLSKDILPLLNEKYDFIYIDGDHSEKAVWIDATLSFKLLKVGGIMIFDDYEWNEGDKSPKKAVDKFLNDYSTKIRVIHVAYQVCIEKISN